MLDCACSCSNKCRHILRRGTIGENCDEVSKHHFFPLTLVSKKFKQQVNLTGRSLYMSRNWCFHSHLPDLLDEKLNKHGNHKTRTYQPLGGYQDLDAYQYLDGYQDLDAYQHLAPLDGYHPLNTKLVNGVAWTMLLWIIFFFFLGHGFSSFLYGNSLSRFFVCAYSLSHWNKLIFLQSQFVFTWMMLQITINVSNSIP